MSYWLDLMESLLRSLLLFFRLNFRSLDGRSHSNRNRLLHGTFHHNASS